VSDSQTTLPNPNPSGSEISPESPIPVDPASLAAHYEQDDVNVRFIVRFAIVFAVAATVATTVLWVAVSYWAG
jgi:hypothetical protein